jgi:hypothetical protein
MCRKETGWGWLNTALLWITAVMSVLAPRDACGEPNPYEITASSYTGGGGADDSVRGCAMQSDGTVVLAVNMGWAPPPRVLSTLADGESDTRTGAIMRLSPDGTRVLSTTRIAHLVLDLAIDDSDNIYVAMWADGIVKLNPTAKNELWSKKDMNVKRIDVGPMGYCAALGGGSDPDEEGSTVKVYDPDGNELGGVSSGKWKFDVCIDEASETVVYLGFRNAHTSGNPVQIAYIRGVSYAGQVRYTCYDWSADESSPRWLNRPTNNMADTRGYRCSIGRDGRLYCAFECAGGNHMFRYDAFDIMKKVSIVGGDRWHGFHNTRSEHKTFFARYEPGTGAYLAGQQFCCRLSNDRGNTARVKGGQICADERGRVYIGGSSAWGLPIPGHPKYSEKPGQIAFNPLNGYLGGAWFLVMSQDFSTRLYCTRLTSQTTHAIAARVLADSEAQIVFGGYTESELYTKAAINAHLQGAQDGWFAVISHIVPGDINGDGSVNMVDTDILAEQWLQAPTLPSADIAPGGGDGAVDFWDFALVADNYGRQPQQAEPPRPPRSR